MKVLNTMTCTECGAPVCKKCVYFAEAESFPLLDAIPNELDEKYFCGECYNKQAVEVIENYEKLALLAQEFPYFSKAQTKETRLVSRSNPKISVKNCADRREVILKLAAKAIQQNCNVMIDVDLISEKIRNNGRQKTSWSGSAIPVVVDPEWLERKSQREL
jgi:hypothetical protein